MKRLMLLLMIALLSSNLVQARGQNLQRIQSKVYDIQDLLDINRRVLDRREDISQDVLDILVEAEAAISKRLRRTGGGYVVVDQKLVKIVLKSCNKLGYWNERRSCFAENLSSERGVLGAIHRSCSSVSRDSESSKCYASALETVQSSDISFSKIVSSACDNLGYWNDRRACYTNFFNRNMSDTGYVVSNACRAATRDSEASKCFEKSLASNNFNDPSMMASLLINGCGELSYWNDRRQCFEAGVRATEDVGYGLSRYTRGCGSISSDNGSAKCYSEALAEL